MIYKIMSNCIIFDLDGTLSNSAADLAAAINHVRTKHGLAEHSLKKVISFSYLFSFLHFQFSVFKTAVRQNSKVWIWPQKLYRLCQSLQFVIHRSVF